MDNIHKPNHYIKNGVECKDIIKTMVSDLAGNEAYYVGNIVKYIFRYKHKNGIEDLQKAKEYIDFLVQEYEKQRY